MHSLTKKLSVVAAMLLAVAFVLQPAAFAAHEMRIDYTLLYDSVLRYLRNGAYPSFGSVNGEWKVFALARSGSISVDSSYAEAYCQDIESMIRSNGSAILNPSKSSDNSRLIIALTSIGRDARRIAGFDLTEPLYDFNYVKRQGINGAIFALLAFDSHAEYGDDSIRNQCVDFILDREISGGGWALSGNNPDPDITAMAIYALAGYKKAETAVDRGINILSELQNADGGYSSWGIVNSESCSQVVIALSTVGINADTDTRFIKNGNSVIDSLCGFFTGEGFSHIAGGLTDGMASEQAAHALCAYNRFLNGENALYDINDVTFSSSETPMQTALPKPTATPKPTTTLKPTLTPKPTADTQKPTGTPSAAALPSIVASSTPWSSNTEEPLNEPDLSPMVLESPNLNVSQITPTTAEVHTTMESVVTPETTAAATDIREQPIRSEEPIIDSEAKPQRSVSVWWFIVCGFVIAAALYFMKRRKG